MKSKYIDFDGACVWSLLPDPPSTHPPTHPRMAHPMCGWLGEWVRWMDRMDRMGRVGKKQTPTNHRARENPYLRDSVTMADDDLIDYNEEEEETPVVHVAGSKK